LDHFAFIPQTRPLRKLDVPTDASGENIRQLDIEEELKGSYLTYAMSVIVSRALPDARDGLKPSQRRILVAMNDLRLGPTGSRTKCSKIAGETMGNYHPHGDQAIYPTLVRMAQEWNMRHVLIDKQGNFGSIAGLPPAAMRYTEARLSNVAAELLEDLERDTVDFVPTYDEQRMEPTVLPGKFPNLLVNGSTGIAVGMASSIPPHNLGEVCSAVVKLIDDPEVTVDELLELVPGPDFPTGGVICGRSRLRDGYVTGRSNIVVRSKIKFEEGKGGRQSIVVTEIPYQQTRDRVMERVGQLAEEGRIPGIARVTDESDRKDPVRIVIDLKRDADRDVVLNQLYQLSPLQETHSVILLALVDGRPRTLSLKELLQEFLRHRVVVIRRRTQYLLVQAQKRKHHVEGLLIALNHIDEIIAIIRGSDNPAEARARLIGLEVPAQILERAFGGDAFAAFQAERGTRPHYTMTGVQADSILQMQLQRLTKLERDKLVQEYGELREEIAGYLRLLAEERNILDVVREDMIELKSKYGDKRRTEINEDEVTEFNAEDLIADEPMTVMVSHEGYIKRMPMTTSRAQGRGGKGITAADTKEGDFLEHVFVASTHAYLLFFTSRGRVHWLKVYDVPQQSRTSRGRAIANMLTLQPEEKITNVIPVRDFGQGALLMATQRGLVKKTALEAYSRPQRGGIIAIKLEDADNLIGVVVTNAGDHVVLSTKKGKAIRFDESDARPMGRATYGVKGITLGAGDEVVGIVVADREATLLTVCERGFGKRTPFGASTAAEADEPEAEETEQPAAEPAAEPTGEPATEGAEGAEQSSERGNVRYRTQRRGGKGLIDIKTTARNGDVVAIASVRDEDEVMIITARGMMVRTRVSEISVIGRNTQGVRLIRLDEGDTVASLAKIAAERESGD
jgi:DNA gyrase subunit A